MYDCLLQCTLVTHVCIDARLLVTSIWLQMLTIISGYFAVKNALLTLAASHINMSIGKWSASLSSYAAYACGFENSC